MAVKWRFKKYLAEKHGIYSATNLRKIIAKQTGVIISLQNLCNYLNSKPKMIRLETIEIICSALSCNLEDFCKITPDNLKKRDNQKLSYKNTPKIKKGEYQFPNPKEYS